MTVLRRLWNRIIICFRREAIKKKMYYNQARKREARKKYQTGLEPVCGAGSTTGRLSKTVVLLISKEFLRDVFYCT